MRTSPSVRAGAASGGGRRDRGSSGGAIRYPQYGSAVRNSSASYRTEVMCGWRAALVPNSTSQALALDRTARLIPSAASRKTASGTSAKTAVRSRLLRIARV